MRHFETSRRGRFNTLVNAVDGTTVAIDVRACVLASPPHVSATVDKRFATLKITDPADLDFFMSVDDEIRKRVGGEQGPGFGPLRKHFVHVKITPKCLVDEHAVKGGCVDAHLTLGNFGAFGYCWIAHTLVVSAVAVTT